MAYKTFLHSALNGLLAVVLMQISLFSNNVRAEEYELVGLIHHFTEPGYYLPSLFATYRINEKSEVGVDSFYVAPNGTFFTLALGDPLEHFTSYSVNSVTSDGKLIAAYTSKSGITSIFSHPVMGEGYFSYLNPTEDDDLFDNPIFSLNPSNIIGECFESYALFYMSATPCGYINGVFKTFNLSLDTEHENKPYLFGYNQSANSMNSSGVVVGEAISNYAATGGDQNSNALRAFSWTEAGGMVELGTLGGKRSAAKDINSGGTIVGYAEYSLVDTYPNRAFFKTASGAMTALNIATQRESVANAINDADTMVGTVTLSDTERYAFVKNEADGVAVTKLSTLTHPIFSEFKLISATDVNNHGEIVGALDGENQYSGYLARLLPDSRRPFPFTGGRSTSGTADFLIWRPSTGTWYALRPKLDNGIVKFEDTLVKQWGLPSDIPLYSTDFDGDKIDDLTVWRPSTGTWYSCLSGQSFDCTKGTSVQFGLPGDIPVVGDFDADGKSDQVVFRRSLPRAGVIGMWYIRRSSDGVIVSKQWGLDGDYPLQGDFNGDNYSDLALFRPSTGSWYVYYSNQAAGSNSFLFKQFGLSGDHPMPRDNDADGITDIVVYRPSSSVWFSCNSTRDFTCFKSDGSLVSPSYSYGLSGDIPVRRNVLGGETEQFAIWRPVDTAFANEGGWYTSMLQGVNRVGFKHWGLKSDIPAGVGIRDLLLMTKQENKAR